MNGELPEGWVRTTLGEVAEVSGGIQKSPKRRPSKNPLPMLRVANVGFGTLDLDEVHEIEVFDGEEDKYALQAGDILVVEGNGSLSQIGRAAMWRGEIPCCVHQNHLLRVRTTNLLPRFLELYLHSPLARADLERVASSTSGLHVLSGAKLRRLPVVVPPKAEQMRIVGTLEEHLSRLDAAQSQLRQVRDRTAQFGGVSVGALLSGVAQRVQLGDVAKVTSGPAFKSAKFRGPGEGIPLLRGMNIEPGSLRWDETRTWPEDLLTGYEHLLVAEGDIILAMDRPLISTGLKLARVREDDVPALLVQRVARIEPADMDGDFLYCCLHHPDLLSHLRSHQTGTQLPHITLRSIREFEVPLLPVAEQRSVAERWKRSRESLSHVLVAERQASRRAGLLRREVLRAAFCGSLEPSRSNEHAIRGAG